MSDLTDKMRDAMYEATDDAEQVAWQTVQLLDAALVAALRVLDEHQLYLCDASGDEVEIVMCDALADEIEASS